MTFRTCNERGRGRTNYHAGRILIPHQLWQPLKGGGFRDYKRES